MRKLISVLFVLLTSSLLLVSCGPTSANGGSDDSEATLSSIEVYSIPTKTTYAVGESLDLTGLILNEIYSDGTKKYIFYGTDNASLFQATDISKLTAGTQTVTITYKTKTATLSVTLYTPRSGKNSWETTIPADYAVNNDFWDNASVYFVLTDRFYNGNTANDTSYGREKGTLNVDPGMFYGGDIKGLTKKLNDEYFTNLGINVIWLSAPYEQIHGWCVGGEKEFKHYPYHGYYALDFTNIDANMGTKEEFKAFVDAAHTKEIRVVLDVVMNHPGYGTLEDLKNLVPGVLKKTDISGATLTNYHDDYIDYKSADWVKWWGADWVRAGFPGYTTGSGDLLGSQASMPDFITESDVAVGLPVFYDAKYKDTTNYPQEGYSLKTPAANPTYRVRDYLIDWLSAWVREYGIDGFRCDTAKHIEKEAWYQLKVAGITAFREWKNDTNSASVIADSKDFWTVGEVFSHGVTKDEYFSEAGFNALINFSFRSAAALALDTPKSIETTYSSYAKAINTDDTTNTFNMLSYISSHDTGSQDSKGVFFSDYANGDASKQKTAGSLLAMCPGAIQVYYGDEAGRENSTVSTNDTDQKNRSQMPWAETGYGKAELGYDADSTILAHWSKMLKFRKDHPAVGGGTHAKIADTDYYAFSRVKGDDKVIVVLGAAASTSITVDVSSIWTEGEIKDAYSETNKATVTDGKVTFTTSADGVLLLTD